MRRAVLTLVAGGVLLAGAAACGTAAGPTPGGPAGTAQAAAGNPSEQAALADTRAVCEALGQVYGKNIGPFAAAVSSMITNRSAAGGAAKTAQAQAQQTLGTFATAVRTATQTSTNPQVRADGAQTADQLRAKSTDTAFFSKIQTSKDLDTLLGPTLKNWLAPVTHHCS
jgi:hypothetical protein